MKQIKPAKALYIKLGQGGAWEKDCIENGHLRLGFIDTSHELCRRRDWEAIRSILQPRCKTVGAATRKINEIRAFYESGSDVLWITVFAGRLWWCFSERKIKALPDNTKTRPVIEKWRDCDIQGTELTISRLGGKLVSTKNFQGTICSVPEFDYLVAKINGTVSKKLKEAVKAKSTLEEKLKPIICDLNPKDFEILIDLIFRQAGWQRISEAGGTLKTLDLDLLAPITLDRYGIQIKCGSNLAEFKKYQEQFKDMKGFRQFYFVVHSPSANLTRESETDEFKLILPDDVAQMCVRYGLTDWLLDKSG